MEKFPYIGAVDIIYKMEPIIGKTKNNTSMENPIGKCRIDIMKYKRLYLHKYNTPV